MKNLNIIFILLILSSCSSSPFKNEPAFFNGDRYVAEENNCGSILKKVFEYETSEDAVNIALKEKKLISIKDKLILVKSPSAEWFSDVKISLLNRIKNWNKNEYPLFYLDSSDQFVVIAKSYAELLTKDLNNLSTDEDKKALKILSEWIDTYKNYQIDLNNLLEERISIQYNINILKKLKLHKNDPKDVQINIKRNGEFVSEIITFRKEDRNLDYIINLYQEQIQELDGKFNNFGKVQERIIRQAMAKDVVTIIQRELEYSVKNNTNISPEIIAHLDELNNLLKQKELEPSTYGVHKITNQVFSKEVADLFSRSNSKDVEEISTQNQISIRQSIENAFRGKNGFFRTSKEISSIVQNTVGKEINRINTDVNNREVKKTSPLNQIYAKVGLATPYQKFSAATKISILGYGAYRFFWVDKEPTTSINITSNTSKEFPDSSHEVQIENTKKISKANSEGNSKVVEIQIDKLIDKESEKRP